MDLERGSETQNQGEFKISRGLHYVTESGVGQAKDAPLAKWVSTDEIIPSIWCMRYSDPENLGRYLLTGRGGIKTGQIQSQNPQVLVLGESSGRGSSREHAQLALRGAGIELVVGDNLAKIFEDNCHNYGIHTLSLKKAREMGVFERGSISMNELMSQYDLVTRDILAYGGLLPYTKARVERKIRIPEITTRMRQMTIAEKIIARSARTPQGDAGVEAVQPGDAVIVKTDKKYAYELQTIISQQVLEETFGSDTSIKSKNVWLFEDHLAHMGPDNPVTKRHRDAQRAFARKFQIPEYRVEENGVEGICHTVMLESHVLPGDLVLGNDSHTCHLGAANALALGKGASEFAAAVVTEDTPLVVPESIRIELRGNLNPGITSKDVMLHLISRKQFRDDLVAANRILQFGGEALNRLEFDDQAVLTNMAIEGQAYTGIIEPNEKLIEYMTGRHNLDRAIIERMLVYPDNDARYYRRFILDLSTVGRMVALPGDTQNAVPLEEVKGVEAQFFYIGSCAGGKIKDLREAARVLDGRKVASGVELQIQASSRLVREQAEKEGLIQIFTEAGVKVITQGCGACMGATEDSSERTEVVLSDTDRNFRGRMGKHRKVYLASSAVVAASAVAGGICAPKDL
ncbi:hypothetical protein A3D07_02845 [Candidatus Curtissbacteria bacterium RIFCSPHIGHO2_02_FULL_42_15]|uniref:Uncharacterized protein n=1 Tax=Candidatus Curtissbacteria bacterium RIFCSPHIGHO2_02_FULL_42_15 TaxID=1797716 RepID=A0A1F5GDA6_9BACT|nr:MAG: hypothetical protein A3D07_02845 [Candidatus Curtissbacteria bacterium RIFCSPHIGHO2_02_FULL_42_15]